MVFRLLFDEIAAPRVPLIKTKKIESALPLESNKMVHRQRYDDVVPPLLRSFIRFYIFIEGRGDGWWRGSWWVVGGRSRGVSIGALGGEEDEE